VGVSDVGGRATVSGWERLGYLRFDAEALRATLYVDLQRMVQRRGTDTGK